jgi:hypothetical protein
MTLRLSAGGQALFTGDPGSALTPFGRIEATSPIPIFSGTGQDAHGNAYDRSRWWPQLEITADLTGLPGQEQAVNVTQLDTYKAVELALGVVQPVFSGGHQRVSLGLEAGFATRLPGSTTPRDKTARWGQILAEISHTEGAAYLRVGLGGDQRLDGDYRLVAIVEGAARLWKEKAGALEGVEIRLVGDAILGLSVAGFVPSNRDVVRIGIALSR